MKHYSKHLLLYYFLIFFLFQFVSVGYTQQPFISARINQYDTNQYNLLIHQQKTFINKKETFVQAKNSLWKVVVQKKDATGLNKFEDYTITFICTNGSINNASVSVDFDFNQWKEKNYVLFPAAVYNGNRYAWRRLRYSPKLHDIKDIGINKPIIINDVPKLSENGGVSRIQERSGSMSTPAMGFADSSSKKGYWMISDQGNKWGDYGMDVAENKTRTTATFSITSPVVREQFLYKFCDARTASWDLPANFKKGDSVVISFSLFPFNAPNTQALFNKFVEIRKHKTNQSGFKNSLSYSECMQTLEEKYNKQNFVEQHGYYAIGMRENFLQDWQIGWTGGMITTYPLLFAGSKTTQERVIKNFNWLFPNGISPSGFYWDAGQKGTEWIGGDIRNMHTKNWHLIRKSGDAIWYIIKQFMLMDQQQIEVKTSWKEGNKKVCDAFVQLWNKYHQIGQFVDSQTGEIVVGGSTSGGIVPAGLALASVYYKDSTYLNTAIAIANYYNQQFVEKGISCGGPGDALQNFDSESAYALVESYVTLYEITKDKQWLTIAENAAKQFITWVVSYNYKYNDTTAFAKANIHTIGGVYANIQNKHSAPGICTASGIGLLKLFRYTNNRLYLDVLQDMAHHITQYLPHPKKPLGNTPFGWVSERVNMTDWEGPQSIGYILPISTWAETSLMLTTIEIPGIYIDAKKSLVTAFDNVNVAIIANTVTELVVEISNPTPTDAHIRVFEDKNTNSIWGENTLYNGQKVFVAAGKTTVLRCKK